MPNQSNINRNGLVENPVTDLELHRQIDPLLRRPDVLDVTGLTQSTLYRLIKAELFPQPVQITDATVGWRQSEIVQWIDERPRVVV